MIFIIGLLVYVIIAVAGILRITIPSWSGTAALIILIIGIVLQVLEKKQ
jgi:hypothetical protein